MKKKRNALTLIEIMLVIILIGIVGGALTVNLKGAVKKGKTFKTEETKRKIESILELALLEGYSPGDLSENWVAHVKASPLMKIKGDPSEILDGWGKPFSVELNDDGFSIDIFSENTKNDEEESIYPN
ncbi:MAG: hypothetical protein S4CHLAM7_09920 [Chlamydiae bacterium]|nr:hypothetical protein [Chlamydiota bacterium]